MSKDDDLKDRLIEASIKLILSGKDPDKLTVRGIASEAGVTFGLVNYYFGTKENLLGEAISKIMQNEAVSNSISNDTPHSKILSILKKNTSIGLKFPSLLRFIVKKDYESGGNGVIFTLLPFLKEYFDNKKSRDELFIIASQIVLPMQALYVDKSSFEKFTGKSIDSEDEYMAVIESILKQALS